MNITNEQYSLEEALEVCGKDGCCTDECKKSQRKLNGLPEIEDCPELIDYEIVQLRAGQTICRVEYLDYLKNEAFKYKNSIWYKLYKFFN